MRRKRHLIFFQPMKSGFIVALLLTIVSGCGSSAPAVDSSAQRAEREQEQQLEDAFWKASVPTLKERVLEFAKRHQTQTFGSGWITPVNPDMPPSFSDSRYYNSDGTGIVNALSPPNMLVSYLNVINKSTQEAAQVDIQVRIVNGKPTVVYGFVSLYGKGGVFKRNTNLEWYTRIRDELVRAMNAEIGEPPLTPPVP
ncbi:MAG: hypothetical protein JSS51_07630 [Planctomycetes bacterium]|nr:hypothetical protein [Planctomycetota bacterium]